MASLSSTLSYEELKKRDSSLRRPKRSLSITTPVSPANENELEDMMTACTPPLDLETDSSDDADDSEVFMRSPLTPLSPFQPASILHRPHKNLQEHASSVVLPSDRNQGQEAGHATTAPVLVNYDKGGAQSQRSRRPTVTFDLDMDDEPPSPPTKRSVRFGLDMKQRSIHFHHDDESDLTDNYSQDNKEDLTGTNPQSGPEIQDSIQQAEQGICQVSFTEHDDDDAKGTRILTSSPVVDDEGSSKQDIILSHVFTGSAPQDMLVALFDRSSELQALAARHSDFFTLIYSSLPKTSRDEFKTLLFKPREELPDRDWMHAISSHLTPLPPCILEKFKGIVGWIDEDEEDVLWGEDEYGYRDSSFEQVQLKWLRDIEDFPLETFQKYYPQFFINARERLEGRRMSHGGDQRDMYVIFCETLSLTRQDLPCDNAWTRRMNACLEKHPDLLLQLKEIIAYEVEYDD